MAWSSAFFLPLPERVVPQKVRSFSSSSCLNIPSSSERVGKVLSLLLRAAHGRSELLMPCLSRQHLPDLLILPIVCLEENLSCSQRNIRIIFTGYSPSPAPTTRRVGLWGSLWWGKVREGGSGSCLRLQVVQAHCLSSCHWGKVQGVPLAL